MVLDNLNRTVQNNDHVVGRVTVGEQDLTVDNLNLSAIPTKDRQLRLAKKGTQVRVLGRYLRLMALGAIHRPRTLSAMDPTRFPGSAPPGTTVAGTRPSSSGLGSINAASPASPR